MKNIIKIWSVAKGTTEIPSSEQTKYHSVLEYAISSGDTNNAEPIDFFEIKSKAFSCFNNCEPTVLRSNEKDVHTYYVLQKIFFDKITKEVTKIQLLMASQQPISELN